MPGRGGIETCLFLMEEAFRGRGIDETAESQAFLANISAVPDDAWRALPAGAARSVESIARHVGSCKVMDDDYVFGSASLEWGTPEAEHERARRTNWGELHSTRWIIAAMVTHDAYHAGEINHQRGLLDGDDRWRHVKLGFG